MLQLACDHNGSSYTKSHKAQKDPARTHAVS